MIGYIYETTNLINNKKYIGKKVAKEFLGNRYLGSGVLLKQAINKYGKQNFNVKLLQICNTPQELVTTEIYYIKKFNCVNSDNYYNLSEGGEGCYGKRKYKHSEQWKQKASLSQKGKLKPENQKTLIKQTLLNKHCKWMYKDNKRKLVKETNINKYLLNGWKYGMGPKGTKSTEQINKQRKSLLNYYKNLSEEERLKKYCNKDRSYTQTEEYKNKMSNIQKGKNNWTKDRIWIHKDNSRHCITQTELQKYLDQGYHKGMYKDKCKLCSSTTIENT